MQQYIPLISFYVYFIKLQIFTEKFRQSFYWDQYYFNCSENTSKLSVQKCH